MFVFVIVTTRKVADGHEHKTGEMGDGDHGRDGVEVNRRGPRDTDRDTHRDRDGDTHRDIEHDTHRDRNGDTNHDDDVNETSHVDSDIEEEIIEENDHSPGPGSGFGGKVKSGFGTGRAGGRGTNDGRVSVAFIFV